MPNPRFRAYLSKYKEVLSQIWSRGRGGCNPLEVLSHKVLKICLIQEIIHFSVFLYQYIILLTSLIYFWRGVSRPQRPPGSSPGLAIYVATLLKLLYCFNTQLGQIWYHLSVFLCFPL